MVARPVGDLVWWLSPAEPSPACARCAPSSVCGGSEPATARAPESLRRFRARSESHGGWLRWRSKRLDAASDVEGASVVLSTDFARLSDRGRK